MFPDEHDLPGNESTLPQQISSMANPAEVISMPPDTERKHATVSDNSGSSENDESGEFQDSDNRDASSDDDGSNASHEDGPQVAPSRIQVLRNALSSTTLPSSFGTFPVSAEDLVLYYSTSADVTCDTAR